MTQRLRVLLFETPHDPYYNLAFEEAILYTYFRLGREENVLRIWRNANAVVIGYFQEAGEEVNIEYAEEIGASIVRRFTGGGAVYHDLGNINYAVITRRNIKHVKEIYDHLIQGILKALETLGLKPYLENINDVVVNNRKVSGTAATRRGDVVFLHGSLLVSTDLEKLSKVLRVSRKKLMDKRVSSVKYRVALLEDIIGRRIGFSEIVRGIVEGYSSIFNSKPYYDLPSKLELAVADILYRRKYLDKEWNLHRKPVSAYRSVYRLIDEVIDEYKKSI